MGQCVVIRQRPQPNIDRENIVRLAHGFPLGFISPVPDGVSVSHHLQHGLPKLRLAEEVYKEMPPDGKRREGTDSLTSAVSLIEAPCEAHDSDDSGDEASGATDYAATLQRLVQSRRNEEECKKLVEAASVDVNKAEARSEEGPGGGRW